MPRRGLELTVLHQQEYDGPLPTTVSDGAVNLPCASPGVELHDQFGGEEA